MEDWITYRLSLLCTDKRGRFTLGVRLRDRAVKVALFLDLVLRDRLWFDDEGMNIDTRTTGYPPADALLRYIDEHPTGTVVDLFTSAPTTMRDVMRSSATSSGRRVRRGVAVDLDAASEQRAEVSAAVQADSIDSPATATLLAVADVLGLVIVDDIDAVIAQCGAATDLVGDCRDYLFRVVDGLKGISNLLNSSSSGV